MLRRSSSRAAGVSALALYVPKLRVDLKEWCEWTKNDWTKVEAVVGASFRIPSPSENAYTMAANAALRLILNNNIDPQNIGFLGLGTESSTDNSAGAVIVRGMLDNALKKLGKQPLSRNCEVPEFKHACLGGVYGLKGACRYADTDGKGRQAIIVSSDIAEYARGSSGEQTQGAGAVAALVEHTPKLFEVHLDRAGNGSAYRGPDFRKPHKRHFIDSYRKPDEKVNDFPVFSGPYSTMAYLEETMTAVENMLDKNSQRPSEFYSSVSGLFFHRPFNQMPIQAISFLYARALARSTSAEHVARFEALCQKARVKPENVKKDVENVIPDLFETVEALGKPPRSIFNATQTLARAVRTEPDFTALLEEKMSLGSPTMQHIGNLYTASLPCWLAAGFEEAYQKKIDIQGRPMVMIGYGSGDAAEAIPMTPVAGWEAAAAQINCADALADPVNLTQKDYADLHSGSPDELAVVKRADEARKNHFALSHIGTRNDPAFQDIGIDYFKFIQ